MRKIAGFLAVLVGLSGIVLSGLGVFYVVRATRWLDAQVPARLTDVEQTLASLSHQTGATISNLDKVRKQLHVLHNVVQELSQDEGDRPVTDALQQSLQESVVAPLQNAEELMLAAHQSMRGLSNGLLVLDSIPLFSLAKSPAESPPAEERPMKSVAAGLEETADLLAQIMQAVSDIRAGEKLSPEQLDRILDALTRVEGKLEIFQGQTQGWSAKLETAQASVALGREKADAWLTYGSAIATLVCVCFGCTQISLLAHGWGLMRRSPASNP